MRSNTLLLAATLSALFACPAAAQDDATTGNGSSAYGGAWIAGYHNSGFKLGNNDSYLLNRFRLQMSLRPTSWLRLVTQTQDARAGLRARTLPPPDLHLAQCPWRRRK